MAPTDGHFVFISFISISLILSVAANICVIVVMLRAKVRSIVNIFISNVAFSDILLASFALPQQVHDVSHAADYFEAEVLCKLVNALPIFCITCSIYSMLAISVERYRSIVLNKGSSLSRTQTVLAVGSIWIFGFIIATPTFIEFKKAEVFLEAENNTSHVCLQSISRTFTIANCFIVLFLCYLIPQVVIYSNYGRLAYFMWQRGHMVAASGSQERRPAIANSVVSKKKVKIIKMLIWVASLFTLSWIPYFTLLTFKQITGTNDSTTNEGAIFMVQLTLATFSASYNTIIYLVYNDTFRAAFMVQICCCFQRSARVQPQDSKAVTVQKVTSEPAEVLTHVRPFYISTRSNTPHKPRREEESKIVSVHPGSQ